MPRPLLPVSLPCQCCKYFPLSIQTSLHQLLLGALLLINLPNFSPLPLFGAISSAALPTGQCELAVLFILFPLLFFWHSLSMLFCPIFSALF